MGEKRGILVVEDDEGIRETLKVMLKFEGYPVHTAADGREGLELLRKITPPGLILLDLMMPVMNGWEFAKALAGKPDWETIPVIVLTAFNEKDHVLESARGVLRKPVEIEDLLQTVNRYCA